MASVQAIAARPVLCRSPVCRPAPSARLSARRSVLVRASPEQVGMLDLCYHLGRTSGVSLPDRANETMPQESHLLTACWEGQDQT